MSSTPATAPKTRVVKLRLSPEALSHFPHDTPPPFAVEPSPSTDAVEQNDSTSTPVPDGTTPKTESLAPPPNGVKRKGIPGPKPGTKRGPSSLMPDGMPKPRGKPGPKKKPRLGELSNGDPASKSPFAGAAPVTSQKVNPKANQGAINANLRALDRTGKPCRRWERKGFQLKSFTGVMWNVPSWRTPNGSGVDVNGDVKSDTTESSDAKANNHASSAVPSDKSNSGGDLDTPAAHIHTASSPALIAV